MKYLKKFIKAHGIVFTVLLAFFLINPYYLGFLGGYALIAMLLLNTSELKRLIDYDFFLLLLYSFSFAVVYSLTAPAGVQFIFIYLLFPAFFYLIGKKIFYKTDSFLEIFYTFFIISFLFSFSALTSVSINLIEGGFAQVDRTIPMFWNGKGVRATVMGAFLTYNMTIPGLLLNYQQKIGKFFMLFAGAVFFTTLLSVFRLGNRTQLVITSASILISLFFILTNQTTRNNFKLIATLTILIVGFLIFFPINLDADYFSVLGSRLQDSKNAGSAGGRTELWIQSIEHIFTDPLGWEISSFGYSHNMWLDVARYTGVIPSILLVIISIRFYFKTFIAVRLKKSALIINSQIVIYSISSFLIFFVEPIMEGFFFLFVSFCMFQGIIHAYIEENLTPK